MTKETTEKVSPIQRVVNTVLDCIRKEGILPWQDPRPKKNSGVPYRVGTLSASKEPEHYSGLNMVALWAPCARESVPCFGTLKQWNEWGFRVKKGSKSLPVVYANKVDKKDKDGNKTNDSYFLWRTSNVFPYSMVEPDTVEEGDKFLQTYYKAEGHTPQPEPIKVKDFLNKFGIRYEGEGPHPKVDSTGSAILPNIYSYAGSSEEKESSYFYDLFRVSTTYALKKNVEELAKPENVDILELASAIATYQLMLRFKVPFNHFATLNSAHELRTIGGKLEANPKLLQTAARRGLDIVGMVK